MEILQSDVMENLSDTIKHNKSKSRQQITIII